MKVINANGALDIYVRCGKDTPTDTVAVFIAHQGRPYTYKTINFSDVNEDHLMVRTSNLPKGVVQITLINHKGHVLCERFVYLYPRHEIRISVEGKNKVYAPYERVNCKLTMKDIKGNPIKGNLSVSIMDALRSDYSKYDNNILCINAKVGFWKNLFSRLPALALFGEKQRPSMLFSNSAAQLCRLGAI